MLLAVGYHYVAERAPASPRSIFPVDVETLTAQLETLGRSFEFVSRDDVLAAVDGEAPLPDRACLVTFDDGLRSQHDIALPVLERLGVPAVFFVSGKPLVEARALTVHKLHAVREAVGDAELARRLESCGLEIDDDAALEHYRYDDVVAARVKYALNALLSPDQAAAIVDATFTDLHGDEAHFCNELYMSPADVAQLERRHAAVGSHGYAHRPLARLDRDARREDLRAGVAALEEVLGSSPRVLSYPYGTRSAVDADTARDAAAAGFRAAFTAERALNATLAEPCLLARFDANDVPGGRRPLLELDNEPRVLPGATGARTLYFDEAAA